ncbi:MAG: hypothetical protein K8J08_11885 [Thermoanaerobaculia bacterium]|nr:hypothetical protein [Thermoanaerobaculia bacterium]
MGKPLRHRLRDGVRYRLLVPLNVRRSRVLGWFKHHVWRQVRTFRPTDPIRLHIGSGRVALEGWVNCDIQTYSEVDVALDVTGGLPYGDVEFIFAEHFLEHLEIESALRFLVDANTALRSGGWLRLTTPNLDWVWSHVYSPSPGGPRMENALHANRSFYGWRHRFLWNREILEEALLAAGFEEVRWCEYGKSEIPELAGVECHERYPDGVDCPHILIAEARTGVGSKARLERFRTLVKREFLSHLED